MNNSQISMYLGMKPSEARKTFDYIRDAFEEVGFSRKLHREILELYANGATPQNYNYYLQKFNAVKLVREQGGYKNQDAEMIVKSGFYDPWVMFQNACLHLLDKPITKEFIPLVIDPSKKRIDSIRDSHKQRLESVAEAQKIVDDLIKPMLKVSEKLGSVEPWKIAGSYPESVRIKINKILFKAGAIDEHGNKK